MAPTSASAQARGGAADELQEVGITPLYIGPGAEVANARLDNNPIKVIRSGSNVSPDEISAAANASSSGVIETVVSTAPYWRVGEENHYWTQQFTYHNAFGQFLSEDDATRSATELYQQDIREQVATIQHQNAAMLIDAFTPYGYVKNGVAGLWNLGVKTFGGALSAPAALTGVDNALAVQDWVSGARINVNSPFAEMVGQSLRPSINQAQAWLEDKIGVGGTIALGAAAEFALDAAVVVPATASLRRLAPQLDIPLQLPIYLDLQQGAVAYSGIPIGVRSPFAPLTRAADPTELPIGSLSISDWSGYPSGVPKPEGPFRLIEGAEYEAARNAANVANSTIRREQGLVGQPVDIHEIHPVKFGGSPIGAANKVILPRDLHRQQMTPWWNQLRKDLGE